MVEEFKDKDLINRIDIEAIKICSEDEKVKINRAITLGGDGTILYTVKMFYNSVIPPIISFGLGSVGYLCSFDSSNYEEILDICLVYGDKKTAINEDSSPNTQELENTTPYLKYRDRICITVNPGE